MASRRYRAARPWLLVGLLLTSCDGDGRRDERRQALDELAAGEFAAAAERLDALLATPPADPAEVQALHLAAGLAAAGEAVDQLSFLTSLLMTIVVDAEVVADFGTAAGRTDENRYILDLVRNIVDWLREPLNRAVAHLGAVENERARLSLEEFTLYFWAEPFFDLKGDWTRADAAILESYLAPLAALLNVAAAHNLDFDFYRVVHAWKAQGALDSSAGIANLVVQLLADPGYPEFLRLRPGGQANYDLARGQIVAASERFRQGVAWAAERTDDDAAIFLVAGSGDERVLRLAGRVRRDADGFLDIGFVHTPEGTGYGDFDIELNDAWLAASERIGRNAADPGRGPVLTLEGDLLPVLLPTVLAIVTNIDLGDTLNDVLRLIGERSDTVVNFIDPLLPDGLALDPGTALDRGAALRDVMPAYRTDLGRHRNNFVFEWECPAFFRPDATAPVGSTASWPGGLDCPREDEAGYEDRDEDDFDLESGPHFGAPALDALRIAPIGDDEIAVAWPVIAFVDASWGGLLVVDPAAVLPDALDPETVPRASATNLTLNAWIARLYDALGGLF